MKLTSKQLGFGILILLGLILAFAPVENAGNPSVSNQQLIEQLQDGAIYVQADELAHWIIDKDPGIQLVDIRSKEDYQKYHIPGNLHLPFEQINDETAYEFLNGDKMIILASNGNTRAGQAWILLKQMGYKEVYILAGGLNNWVNVFSNPEKPQGGYTDDEIFTYEFRKSAGPVMMGKSITVSDDNADEASKPKPVKRIRSKKKKKVDEGC